MTRVKGILLAAGLGTRLDPITRYVPKALCPVDNVPLVDRTVERVRRVASEVAVNVHAGAEQMLEHLEGGNVHISFEREHPLGTAGAIVALRDWIDGQPCLVANCDAHCNDPFARLLEGWDGDCVRLLVSYDADRPDFEGIWRFAGASLLPSRWLSKLTGEPESLFEACWRPELESGSLEFVPTESIFIDCGTPAGLLAANLVASGGQSVIAPDSVVEGTLKETLVFPAARVDTTETLERAIRLASGETILPFPSSRHMKD